MPDLLFSILTLTPLFLPPSSVSLSYFILAIPMRKCLGKHSCTSSLFPIAILNATLFFRSVMAMNNWKRSGIKQIILLLIKFYHIMFIIILFTLDFDELFSRFFYCLSKENSHGMCDSSLGGGSIICHFLIK